MKFNRPKELKFIHSLVRSKISHGEDRYERSDYMTQQSINNILDDLEEINDDLTNFGIRGLSMNDSEIKELLNEEGEDSKEYGDPKYLNQLRNAIKYMVINFDQKLKVELTDRQEISDHLDRQYSIQKESEKEL